MSGPRFIVIGGQRVAWTEILKLRREQRQETTARQLTLFELRNDSRPPTERSAEGRFLEPSLFTLLDP